MSFKFLLSDGSVTDGCRRIAIEQLDKAVGEAGNGEIRVAERILRVRKRCKKLRGLLRLVGPAFPGYAKENAALRDAAAGLSGARDADVLVATFDNLLAANDALGSAPAQSNPIREELLRRHHAPDADPEAVLSSFADALQEIHARAGDWALKEEAFDAISDGLVKTYKSARKAMASAEKTGSALLCHAWRRHVKYHWHHLGLLRDTAPDVLTASRSAAQRLAELLGDHHDLAVLVETIAGDMSAFGAKADVKPLLAAARDRQNDLARQAFVLGHEIFAETPSALSQRLHEYWRSWRNETRREETAMESTG